MISRTPEERERIMTEKIATLLALDEQNGNNTDVYFETSLKLKDSLEKYRDEVTNICPYVLLESQMKLCFNFN